MIRRTATLAALVLVTSAGLAYDAFAQTAGAPQLQALDRNFQLPQPANPPGQLEGQGRPPQGAAQPQPPAPTNAPGGEETFVTRNGSAAPAWISVYQGGALVGNGCLTKDQRMAWTVDRAGGPVRVRAELTNSEACAQPVSCETAAERAPGVPVMEVQASGKACSLQATRPILKASIDATSNVFVRNDTQWNVWATFYAGVGKLTRIVRTGCITKGTTYKFGEIIVAPYYLRTELVRSTSPRNCSAPVDCDTKASLSVVAADTGLIVRANPKSCWIDPAQR